MKGFREGEQMTANEIKAWNAALDAAAKEICEFCAEGDKPKDFSHPEIDLQGHTYYVHCEASEFLHLKKRVKKVTNGMA